MHLLRPTMPGTDQPRAEHQAARADLLLERADERIDEWMRQHISDVRLAAFGPPDTSANPLASFALQASSPGLYCRAPTIRHRNRREVEGLVGPGGLIDNAGLWPRQQFVQYLTVGLKSCAVRVEAPDGLGRLGYRVVLPHNVYAVAHPDDPTVPVQVWELRVRTVDTGGAEPQELYAWDVWSTENGGYFGIHRADRSGALGEDITGLVVGHGPREDDEYPFRSQETGEPVLPWVIYRSTDDGTMWAWERGRGVFRGSLNAMLNWTYAGHTARDASGKMVLLFDADPAVGGDAVIDAQGRHVNTLQIEPGSIVPVRSHEDKQGRAQEVGPGGHLKDVAAYARQYELQQLVRMGLNPSDISRLNDGPTSGVALYMSNHQKRELQQQFGPLFRRADLELLRVSAVVAQSAGLGSYPETGYSITYAPIPKSPAEEGSEREHLDWQVDRGILSVVDRYLVVHPGSTRDDAIEQLAQSRLDEALVEQRLNELAAAAGVEASVPQDNRPPEPAGEEQDE